MRTLAVFAVDPFLRASLPSTTWRRFSLLLGDRSGTLFEHVIADESELQLSLPVDREGLGWTLGLTVSSDFLDNRRSALPESALGGGLLVAMLLGLSAHLAAQGRYRALSLRTANSQMGKSAWRTWSTRCWTACSWSMGAAPSKARTRPPAKCSVAGKAIFSA